MQLGPELLRSFVAVAENRSFTAAARKLGLRQSTVSQHVGRLEKGLKRRLLARDTHAVALTVDGSMLLDHARAVLEALDRLGAVFAGSELSGVLRLGVSEDFVQDGLAAVLSAFTRRHATIDLALTIGLSGALYDGFDAGDLDVILAKRRRGDTRGQVVWREPLAWIGRPGIRPDPERPLPLILFPPPSITRDLALAALEEAGRDWRIVCASGSLSGIHAAAQAGLGVAPHSASLVPPGLARLRTSRNLPALAEVEFVVIGARTRDRIADAVVEAILRSGAAKREPIASIAG